MRRNMWGHKISQDQLTSLWGAGGWPRVSMLLGQVGTSCESQGQVFFYFLLHCVYNLLD
jgi:hypothetical protein